MAIIVSSLGIHIMHHDVKCCGHPSEVIVLVSLFDHADTVSCSNTETEDDCCESHSHHSKDCCSREVIILKDSFFSQEMKMGHSMFSLLSLAYINLKFNLLNADNIEIKPLHPPPLKIPSFATQFTSAFRC